MDLLHTALAFFIVFGLLTCLYLYANRGRKYHAGKRLGTLFCSFPFQAKRKTEPKALRELEILRRINLTATHQLHLIATPAGKLLLCTHAQGCTILSPAPAFSSPGSPEFSLEQQFLARSGEPILAN